MDSFQVSSATAQFFAGVIEGFYGQSWTEADRFALFDWMAGWGLNTYLYAPKDDLKHRALWREAYSPSEEDALRRIIARCAGHGIRFIYGLSPGLDIRYKDSTDVQCLKNRFEQIRKLGCADFALLFDDIPVAPTASVASQQARVANALRREGESLVFCPTVYCGRMMGKDYLLALGQELAAEINVFWTGPEIISREISVAHVRELQEILRRKPLVWDNLFANDYDGRRFYCGPYSGRPPELREAVNGLLVNPNNESPLNFVPLRTFAQFVHSKGTWDARKAYLAAMREWFPRFGTIGEPLTIEDLVLFGDCYYLPHEEGPDAAVLLRPGTFGKEAIRLRNFCARISDLRDRNLFHALSRRAWELREELDLLIGYSERRGGDTSPYHSGSHLPGTYRGGMVARLQRLLKQHEDGSFTP